MKPTPTRTRSRILARTLVVVVVVLVLAAACGDADSSAGPDSDPGSAPDPSPGNEVTEADLEGRAFWSTRVVDAGEDRAVVAGTQIEVSFGDGTVGASAGCNSMGGVYVLEGDTLVVGDMAMTQMGCDPERHDQDDFVAEFLQARPSVTLVGDVLTLEVGDSVIELLDREIADPDVPIVGTRWQADGFIDGEVMMAFAVGEAGWLEFTDQSSMIGFDGCRDLSAPVEVAEGDVGGPVEGDGEVQFGEITATGDGACDFPDYQKAFSALFATGEATITVQGAKMTALNSAGQGITFVAR